MTGEALGQLAPGRSGISTADRLENVRAFRELNTFGRCYAATNRNEALSLLATNPGTREEGEVFRTLMRGEQSCLFPGSRMELPVIYFRGVIAEGLLETNTSVPASYRLPAPSVGEVRDLGGVARCYVVGHRAQVQSLLATGAGSPEEVAAVQALWNDFRACLPPDARIRLNATWIRFLLAEALLRLAPDAVPAAGN
jgi:hypothetical protein